jgi:hypothetical protein
MNSRLSGLAADVSNLPSLCYGQGAFVRLPMLSAEFALDQVEQAFAEASKRGALKVLLRP